MLFGQEFMPLEDLLFFGAASGGKLSELTASGNPVVFETNVARPLKRLSLSLLPRQSGTGDPSPSNIRPLLPWGEVGTWHTGVNVWDEELESGSINFSTGAKQNSSVNIRSKNYIPIVGGETYYGKAGTLTSSACVIFFYTENKTYISNTYGGNTTFAVPSDAKYALFYCGSAYGTTYNHDISINYPSTDTEYHPYTGQSYPVNLRKNLFDIIVYDRNGVVATKENGKAVLHGTADGSAYNVTFKSVTLQAGTYTASISGLQTGMICALVKDGLWFKQVTSSTTFTLTEEATISGYVYEIDGTEVNATVAIQLEQGERATDFQPYLPPVYGCSVDLTTGEVWGTHVLWEKNTASMNNTETYPGWGNAGIRDIVGLGKNETITTIVNVGSKVAVNTNGSNDLVYMPRTYYSLTQDEWIELAIDIQIALPLATPVLLATLTAQQVSALVGVNTVWSDADNVDVTYLKKG